MPWLAAASPTGRIIESWNRTIIEEIEGQPIIDHNHWFPTVTMQGPVESKIDKFGHVIPDLLPEANGNNNG